MAYGSGQGISKGKDDILANHSIQRRIFTLYSVQPARRVLAESTDPLSVKGYIFQRIQRESVVKNSLNIEDDILYTVVLHLHGKTSYVLEKIKFVPSIIIIIFGC